MAHFCIKRMVKSKKSSLSRGRICSIKAASTAILTLNGTNITLMDQRFPIKKDQRNLKYEKRNILKTIQEIQNSGLWGMFPVRISIQMGGRTVIVDLISFHNLLHCAIPFFPRIPRIPSGIINCSEISGNIRWEIWAEKIGKSCPRATSAPPPLGPRHQLSSSGRTRGWSGPKHQTAPNKTPPSCSPKGGELS